MATIIKNATIVSRAGQRTGDVKIDGEKIVKVEPAIDAENHDEVIDATGKYLLPGVIDDQVHFRTPGFEHKEDFEHATRACAKGGVTSFLEMPNTNPTTTTVERLHEKLESASKRCFVNYGFYMGATPNNLVELQSAKRTPGIKIFIGSSTGDLLVDEQSALEQIFAETSLPICAHCEDESTIRKNRETIGESNQIADHSRVRDHRAAVIATTRAIDLSTRHNHPFHVLHVSTADEIPLIAEAGDLISAEVCPHHLFFQIDDYERLGSWVKMNPSIKTRADNEALWNALLDGTISLVATDHAPHTLEEKQLPYPECPSGLPAIENSLALMLNQVHLGRCTLEQVVGWMCEAPAKVWNIANKGKIAEGWDADLVLVDLDLEQQIVNERQQTKSKWSPWHGESLTGWAVRTWVMGHEVFRLENGFETYADEPLGHEIQFKR